MSAAMLTAMNDQLARICATKRQEIAASRAVTSLAMLDAQAEAQTPPRGFLRALLAPPAPFALIAEIKRMSPSRGLIRADFAPADHARAYARGGAACLSVLTDACYFGGAVADLIAARDACDLPVLRKDFMLDIWQIAEARAMGADAVLLIVAALADDALAELADAATARGMDVLIEVHDADEMARAAALLGQRRISASSCLIGINNRDLKSFVTDLGVTEALAPLAPPGVTLIAESGIAGHDDLVRLAAAGARGFLVGETLMREDNLAAATQRLLTGAVPSR